MTAAICRRWQGATLVVLVLAGCGDRPVDAQREAAAREAASAATPPPPALPRTPPFARTDREAWRRRLAWPTSCEDAFQATQAGADGGLIIAPLAPGLSIVEVLCASGAYQPSHVWVRFDERGSSPVATTLAFPMYEASDGTTLDLSTETELFGHARLLPETRELLVLSLSRQTADCGVWSRYSVATEDPAITAAAARLPCPSTPGSPAELAGDDAPRGWRPIRLTK